MSPASVFISGRKFSKWPDLKALQHRHCENDARSIFARREIGHPLPSEVFIA
jgi:hypothetical protein